MVLTDTSFSNAEGMKSQLGYEILLVDQSKACKIIYYGSNKCKRVARSVVAAVVQALVLGLDYSYLVRNLAEELIGRSLPVEAMIYSRTVPNVVATDATTTESRLHINILVLRQRYDQGATTILHRVDTRDR